MEQFAELSESLEKGVKVGRCSEVYGRKEWFPNNFIVDLCLNFLQLYQPVSISHWQWYYSGNTGYSEPCYH